MALLYHPRPGEIFVCEYPRDMHPPEMVKARPVVVISPNMKYRGGLVTVVPLTASEPKAIMPYHQMIEFSEPLAGHWNSLISWAICDHAMTVSLKRLNLIRVGKDETGKRIYVKRSVNDETLERIRKSVCYAIGINVLDNCLNYDI